MKKLSYLIVLTLILGLVLTGCLLSNVGQVPTTGQSGIAYLTKGTLTNPDVFPLYAGQTIPVGTVSVWNDGEELHVVYNTTDGWEMAETHLAVATSLDIIPQKNGNPIPGKFPYKHEDLGGVTNDEYVISLNGWKVDTGLCIAAHAKVVKTIDELVANGDFEVPTTVGTWSIFATGTPGLAWTVEPTIPPWDEGVPEGLELQRISTPNSGNQYAELDAYDPVRIYQYLSTWPEGRCTLTYAWSPRPDNYEYTMEVWWNGKKIATHTADGIGKDDTFWTVETYPGLVPNASGMTCLEFIETGFDDQYGMFLDSVSVDCIQEESAWAGIEEFPGKNWAKYFNYLYKTVAMISACEIYEGIYCNDLQIPGANGKVIMYQPNGNFDVILGVSVDGLPPGKLYIVYFDLDGGDFPGSFKQVGSFITDANGHGEWNYNSAGSLVEDSYTWAVVINRTHPEAATVLVSYDIEFIIE